MDDKLIYNTAAWKKLRAYKLSSEPLCEECEGEGKLKRANVVDHRVAISQGGAPFPELSGLASLCARHHNMKTARSEEAGAVKRTRPRSACDADGNPLDRDHPWNADPLVVAGKARARPDGLRPPLCHTIVVCGAPGSGKSTLARTMAEPSDVVLDLDEITADLAGQPIYHAARQWLAPALMPRPNRGAFLKVFRKRFYICWFEGGSLRKRSTGTADSREAEGALAEFIRERQRRERPAGPRDPREYLIADALDLYGELHAPNVAAPERIAYSISALLTFWAENMVADVTDETCRAYVEHRRMADGTLRKELGTLRHTCGTWLAQAGVPLFEIGGWLGHSHEHTVTLYAHHHPDYLETARKAADGRGR